MVIRPISIVDIVIIMMWAVMILIIIVLLFTSLRSILGSIICRWTTAVLTAISTTVRICVTIGSITRHDCYNLRCTTRGPQRGEGEGHRSQWCTLSFLQFLLLLACAYLNIQPRMSSIDLSSAYGSIIENSWHPISCSQT